MVFGHMAFIGWREVWVENLVFWRIATGLFRRRDWQKLKVLAGLMFVVARETSVFVKKRALTLFAGPSRVNFFMRFRNLEWPSECPPNDCLLRFNRADSSEFGCQCRFREWGPEEMGQVNHERVGERGRGSRPFQAAEMTSSRYIQKSVIHRWGGGRCGGRSAKASLTPLGNKHFSFQSSESFEPRTTNYFTELVNSGLDSRPPSSISLPIPFTSYL